MPISMRCPNPECGRASRLPDNARGRWARCPACGHKFQVPAEAPSAKSTQGPVLAETLPTTPPSRKPASPTQQTLPAHIGRFVIKERLGAGAFGAVYRAHDPQLGREVALKVPHPGALSEPRLVERFLREGRAAAGLHHPHIVPVFDAGQDGPQHYLAAAFIPGPTLAHECAGGPLEFRRAAELVRQLGEALAYAHGQGIVHRDIKPANVLLDERGEAHLADFGLAHRADEGGELTREGAVMGTPAYMAPEQAEGQKGEPLPASDQYSLGAVLYELLTGEAPFSGPPAIVLYNVIHQEPEPPHKRNPAVPPELEAVCLKALAKRPEGRYADCGDFAADLRRWLEGDPVSVRPLRVAGRCLRWLRREPKLAALAALTLLCLLIASVVAISKAQQLDSRKKDTAKLAEKAAAEALKAEEQKKEAQDNTDKAQTQAGKARLDQEKARKKGEEAKAHAERQRQQTKAAEKDEQKAKEQEREARLKLYNAHLAIAQTALSRKDTERSRAALARHFPVPGQQDLRNAAWHTLWMSLPLALTYPDHQAHLTWVAFSPTSQRVLSGSADQTVRTRLDSDRPAVVLLDFPGTITALAIDPPGWTFAGAAGTTVRLGYTSGGKARATLNAHTATVTALAFCAERQSRTSGDSKALASAASGEKVIVWKSAHKSFSFDGEFTTWKPLPLEGKPGVVRALAFRPDGLTLAATSDTTLWLWDVETGKRRGILSGHQRIASCIAFSPNGMTLASGADDGTVKLWDVAGGKLLATLRGQPGPVHVVAFTPDGRTLAAGGEDDKVWFWDVATGKELGRLPAAGPGIRALSFGSEGQWVTVLSHGLKRKTIPLNAVRMRLVIEGDGSDVICLAVSPDSRTLAAGRVGDGKVRLYDLLTGKKVGGFEAKAKGVDSVAFSPDGKTLAISGQEVRLWDVRTGKLRLSIKCRAAALAFSPDGKTLAAGESLGGSIRLFDPATGKEKRSLGRVFGPRLVFSPDSKNLAASSVDGIKLWDVASGQERRFYAPSASAQTLGVSFSPDSKTLVAAYPDGTVRFWGVAAADLRGTRGGAGSFPAFSPDGRTVAFSSDGKTLQLGDLTTGKERGAVKGAHKEYISQMVFSPDGRTLVSAGQKPRDSAEGSTIKVWDVGLLPDFDKR